MTNTIEKEETNSEEKEQNPILERAAEMTEEEMIGLIENGPVDPGNVQITENTVAEGVEEGTDTVLLDLKKWHLL